MAPGPHPGRQASATRLRIAAVPHGITLESRRMRATALAASVLAAATLGQGSIAKTLACAASNNCKVCRGKTPLVLDPPALRPATWKIGYPEYGVGLMKKIA